MTRLPRSLSPLVPTLATALLMPLILDLGSAQLFPSSTQLPTPVAATAIAGVSAGQFT